MIQLSPLFWKIEYRFYLAVYYISKAYLTVGLLVVEQWYFECKQYLKKKNLLIIYCGIWNGPQILNSQHVTLFYVVKSNHSCVFTPQELSKKDPKIAE